MGLGFALVLAQAPVCLPGTTVCAVSDGRGGVKLDASGQAQASPQGVSASGRAGAAGDAGANAGAVVQGSASDNDGSGFTYQSSHGRRGSGMTLCPIVRLGVWSGFKAGGCLGFTFRWEAAAFEMETQLLYGGVSRSFDWSFPLSLVVPLDNDDSLFSGPYLRFGGSPVGATFAREEHGGSYVRFGLFAGAGYELELARSISWRVFDLRLSFDLGTRRSMDEHQRWFDPGVQLGTGLIL